MSKNLKLSYVLLLVFTAIIVSFRTLLNFCGGVGLSFVALFTILTILLYLLLTDEYVKNRIKDMFIVVCVFIFFEFMIYIVFEFGVSNVSVIRAFLIMQNVLTALGLIFLCYVFMRMFLDLKGVKLSFIEIMLGNEKRNKTPKKAKELTNGSLEEKPNKKGVRESTVMFSNGVVNSVDKRKLDANGDVIQNSVKPTKFSINHYYTQNHNRSPIDYQGRLADFMPKESVAFVGMSQEQIDAIKKQFKEHPGQNENPDEFSKKPTRNLFTRLGNYLRNQGEAILTQDNEFVGLSEEEIEEIKRMRNEGYR